jgi:hypothetical protein
MYMEKVFHSVKMLLRTDGIIVVVVWKVKVVNPATKCHQLLDRGW